MAMRYEDATIIYQETLKEISHDENSWSAFLRAACKNYRLPFADLVLIYAQRPDATAVLEMEDWNKRYGRWIKTGSKGIAVFDSDYDKSARLKYYFDITDTKETHIQREVPIWNMKKEYEAEVIQTLQEQFGSLEKEESLAEAILSATNNVVEDNIDDYRKDLDYGVSNSLLDGLDEQSITHIYKNVLASSVAYATLSRCGIYADDYISASSLRQVSQFNTVESLNALGVPTKDISQMVIGEIRKTVLMLVHEEKENRTFAKDTNVLYNEDVKDTSTQERSHKGNENRIYETGRVSDSQSNTKIGGSDHVGEIRADKKAVSQENASNLVYELSDDTNTEPTLDGNRSNSQQEKRIDDNPNDEGVESGREAQRIEPDGMGSSDELYRRNDTPDYQERTDLHLNTNEEVGIEKNIPAFFTLDEYEELLKYDKFRVHKNKDIQTVFQYYSNKEKRISFVKESFPKAFIETLYQEQRMGFYPEEEKDMLRVWKGSYLNPDYKTTVSWEDVTLFIQDMIERNIYLSIPLKPIPTTQEQQMNLFDMEPIQTTTNTIAKTPFSMSQYIIDAILMDGTEEKNDKMKITIFFSLDRPIEENAKFLSDVYGKGSNGFIINQRNVSYLWNESGMQVSWGKGIVVAFDKQTITWEDAAKNIRNLLDNGRYISQEEMDACKEFEYKECAATLWYMCQDVDINETNRIINLREHYSKGFPDGTAEIAELLKTREFYESTMEELHALHEEHQINPDLMRNGWNQYAPKKVIPVMERLAVSHITFKANAYTASDFTYFITQDTIDHIISYEHRTNQKYDTYSFFLNHFDKNERVKFLKDMWGQGGSSHYDSDAKGLKVKTGSYHKPYASILLKWKEVADRTAYLISNHKYLTPQETSGLEDYERGKVTNDIKSFFARLSFNTIRPYCLSESFFNEDKALNILLKDKDNIPHVLDLMQIALNNTAEIADDYEKMVTCYAHVQEYYYGTYTLFNQKKEVVITTPYEADFDINHSIATALTVFMEEYDSYEFRDHYDETEFEIAVSDTNSMLNDVAGVEDLIRFMNQVVFEDSDPQIVAKAEILREEISILYAQKRGSNLIDGNEVKQSYHSYISQEEPRYNTGDFAFLFYEGERIYGSIELIDEDEITLQRFPHDLEDDTVDKDIIINKIDFDKAIVHDFRNGYLYDQTRRFFRVEVKQTGLIAMSDKDRNTLGYQNFALIEKIAPLIINKEATEVTFTNAKEDSEISITYTQNTLTIKEEAEENFEEYVFEFDIYAETLNIREITVFGECEKLNLVDGDVYDYNEEQQMNEDAIEYIKSIGDRGYWLHSIDMPLNGLTTNIVYTIDGNISELSNNQKAIGLFMERFANDPINNISSLIPIYSEGKENVHIVQKTDIAHDNYNLLKQIAPLIASNEAVYMYFVAGEHMMPLSIEKIYDNHIAISHYYEQNDRMLADPDMEFLLDTEKERLSARKFQQDNMNYYRSVETSGDEVLDPDLEKELDDFSNGWLHNIINNEYRLEKIRIFSNSYTCNIEYGKDGNITEIDATEDGLKWFEETYGGVSHERISTLLPEVETNENTPSQKNSKDTDFNDTVKVAQRHIEKELPASRIYPDISNVERHNFEIRDFDLGVGGPKEKYKANINAIQLLKQLDQEQRLATPPEQEVLSKYVGWGGLSDAFDKHKENWRNEYQELKDMLNDKEYEAARESTLTAFYTPPIVIESIYQKLIAMGLRDGNILEPSCGVGNFIGMQPKEMDCNFYGVELDNISGMIAKQLYQKETIAIQGFEKVDISDNLFDAVIGNVPYGQIPVFDPKYNQQHFMIHDYFFAKALDKVKVGGVVILLTSKFTLDKQTQNVRKYIAQRANLLGAIRLPDDTFRDNAGTRVTTDILILQKNAQPIEYEPDWLSIDVDENGIKQNSYFINHPEMVLGTMVEEPSQYGVSSACKPIEGADLKQQLSQAMEHINAKLTIDQALFVDEEDNSIPADPTVRNFSFCVVGGNLYYRENSRMYPYKTSKTGDNRIRGMIQIRDCMRKLIDYQMNNYPDDAIDMEQEKLHTLYDSFTKKYSLLSSRANKAAFEDDSSYCLICSLEILTEDRTFNKKADIFYKRTIKPRQSISSVKTASEALIVCVAEKGHIDFDYMTKISKIAKEELLSNLQNVIFPNPQHRDENQEPYYETADEYLSGDVREKLSFAKHAAKQVPELYSRNVEALERVQPERIKAGDISVRLGTTWIPIEFYKEFMYELLATPKWYMRDIDIFYVSSTQEWNISRKSLDKGIKATKTYGTNRVNGYKILENSLNLRDVKVFDKTVDDNGVEVRLLNKKETAIAQDKQDMIKAKFAEWIWKDPDRREQLCSIYNDKFNSIRNRTFDGSNLSLVGMNPDIALRKHQVDAIARILYGGNTLLAHCVGAGKTFEMIGAGMESKRLGFCNKPLFVVPNNIISDFASDFYRLYPSANILVATTDTLSKANRHRFFSRIATGDWDGIIITHSQFIKMPVSTERQNTIINRQVDEISNNIKMLKEQDGERFTIKQLEKMKQKLDVKLQKLNDSSKKDDILCFEQLGVDMLFVDEADLFKNLFLYSKMRNVSGISQTDSQRASDLFMKTQYLDEITNGRGVVFATGTAISNSMTELYTMQRYLQYSTLQKYNLEAFDSWASTFGETVTAMELAPEGSGFRMKTRFSKFFNLPELMTVFREVADIQTPDMLNLPVPKANFEVSSVPASKEQRDMIIALGERAEKVRNREVQPHEDNMLKITSDGRKVALEQRLINGLLPENENSKIIACVNNIHEYWKTTSNINGTQLVFCDLSTPTKDSNNIDVSNKNEANTYFKNVYQEVKNKLVSKGIPLEQIAFIHDAKTDIQRKELFAKVRQGKVRLLIGSTSKMGAGTNVQDLIIALHDLDCPWRPRDLEQRQGRGVRQGNINEEVHIFRYVTEGTFDAYLYQTIEKKQQFISQVLTGKTPQRTMEEIDESVLNYAEIKAIACGDPKIMERCNIEMEVNKLNVLKAGYQNQKFELQDSILKVYPQAIARCKETIKCLKEDILLRDSNPLPEQDSFVGMILDGVTYTDKAEAGNLLIELCRGNTTSQPVVVGQYRSFTITSFLSTISSEYILSLENKMNHPITLGTDKLGNILKMNNVLNNMERELEETSQELSSVEAQLQTAKIEVEKPFEKENELQEKTNRLAKLTMELKLDENDPTIIDDNEVDDIGESEIKTKSRER